MEILHFLLILSILTIFVCTVSLIIIYHNQSIISLLYKINISEQKIDDTLKNKEDLLKKVIRLIEIKLKLEIKAFKDFKDLPNNITNQEKDICLNTAFNEIKIIADDNNDLSEIKDFDDYIDEIKNCDVILGGIKIMNNKYVCLYNEIICKTFKKIISKLKNYQTKPFYELCEIKEIEL